MSIWGQRSGQERVEWEEEFSQGGEGGGGGDAGRGKESGDSEASSALKRRRSAQCSDGGFHGEW
eukprot:753999-Hanusia_phi.AAC.1